MKSERRHELQHNVLLEWMIQAYKKVEPYTNAILAVLLLSVVALLAWSWWKSRAAETQSQGWDELYAAIATGQPENLDVVIQRFSGSNAAHWAAVVAGDMHLDIGCGSLLNNRALATQELQKARDSYLPVIEQASNPRIQERATFGLARTYEAMASTRQSQGELERAIEQYQKVLDQWPGGAYADWAGRRLGDLKLPETKAFYDEVAKYQPERPASSVPSTGPIFNPDALNEPSTQTPSQTVPDSQTPLTLPIETPASAADSQQQLPTPPESSHESATDAPVANESADAPEAENKPEAPQSTAGELPANESAANPESKSPEQQTEPAAASDPPDQPAEGALDDPMAELSSEPREFLVEPSQSGWRLDVFLAHHLSDYSRVLLRRIITAGGVRVDTQGGKPAYRLKPGQRVSVVLPPLPRSAPKPEEIPLDILYDDEWLAVVNKPPGMVVHPARGHWSGTLASALQFHFGGALSTTGGPTRPGIVHRLDRDTSGAILIAKGDIAHGKLAEQFQSRTLVKEYFAIVAGTLLRDRDLVDAPIGAHPIHREKMAIRSDHTTSRHAQTFYEILERFDHFAAIRVLPKTGRTHQIRVHLDHIGCPVLCDRQYGGRARITRGDIRHDPSDALVLLDRQALHAQRLRFQHPANGRTIEVEAPLPADLLGVLEELRAYRSLE